jgi:putative ABC transport system permease protein
MLKNYFIIAWRNLWRNKSFSLINLTGLALGLSCSLLIMLWVQHELSVDAYHTNSARLYTIYEREYYADRTAGNYDTPGVLADEIKKLVPEVTYATTLEEDNRINTFQVGDKVVKMEGTAAGADLFKMFSYPLIEGTPSTALNAPEKMAISRKMAEIFFESPEAAMGKTIKFKNKRYLTVAAVFENLPENTSRKFDYLISWEGYLQDNPWHKTWVNGGPLTYLMLREDAHADLVDKKLTHFLDNYNKSQNEYYRIELGLQKFADVYLHASFKDGHIVGGRIAYVNLFSIIAVFILLIACINFMNLTTARSVKRAKEIGVRKAIGAVRSTLVKQFIGESLFLTFLAVGIALLLVVLLLPVFSYLTQKELHLPFYQPIFWVKLGALTLVTGLIAGSYPALHLSSFNTVKVLKGTIQLDTAAVWFRKGLVVFQFVLSGVLIIGTIVVSKQVSFIQQLNLGYDRENLISIPMEGTLQTQYDVFKAQILQLPGIQAVTTTSDNIVNLDNNTNGVDWEGKLPGYQMQFSFVGVRYDFTQTMKLKVLAGRDFSPAYPTDKDGFLINETAAKMMGYTNPVGRSIIFGDHKGNIIGLVKDFHFESIHQQIQPLIIRFANYDNHMLVRTQPGQTKAAINSLEKLCKKMNPDFPFTYSFTDESYNRLYDSEQIMGRLSHAFAALAIFIACLGLLGLSMFTAEQRKKEMGIRKILGASVSSLFRLLSAEFIGLVFIALLIASPLAWYVTSSWLKDFAYHTTVSWWIFAGAGAIAMVIALITVSGQVIKAALMNPVKSLKE